MGKYLIGFLFLAGITRIFVDSDVSDCKELAFGMVIGNLVIYLFGSAWLAGVAHPSFISTLIIGALPYIGFDVVKLAVALATVQRSAKQFKNAIAPVERNINS